MKKIFIALSFLMPMFCWANASFDFSINNKINIVLPENIKKMYSLEVPLDDSESTPIYVFMTDKGYKIHIRTISNKKDIRDKSLYDYYLEMFTNSKTENQKNFYKQMNTDNPDKIEGEDFVIFSYPFYENRHFYIFSKKLNFVVVVVCPKKLGSKFINQNTVKLR